jgi:hypothetical protein
LEWQLLTHQEDLEGQLLTHQEDSEGQLLTHQEGLEGLDQQLHLVQICLVGKAVEQPPPLEALHLAHGVRYIIVDMNFFTYIVKLPTLKKCAEFQIVSQNSLKLCSVNL